MKMYNSTDIVDALKNGAKLYIKYGVYNYSYLELSNGDTIYKLRKRSPQLAMAKIKYNMQVLPDGYVITKSNFNENTNSL